MEAAGIKSGAMKAAAPAGEAAVAAAQPVEKNPAATPEPKPKLPRPRVEDKWKIFSGTANDALAKEVCEKLGLPLGQTHITRFSDVETYVQILENARGAAVFMIQPTCDPV